MVDHEGLQGLLRFLVVIQAQESAALVDDAWVGAAPASVGAGERKEHPHTRCKENA